MALNIKTFFKDNTYISPIWKYFGSRQSVSKIVDDFRQLINSDVEIAFFFKEMKSSKKIIKLFKEGLKIYVNEKTIRRYGMLSLTTLKISQILKKDKELNSIKEKYYSTKTKTISKIFDFIVAITKFYAKP